MQETISTIVITILGGINIFQLLFWRSQKKKMSAEADQASVEAKQSYMDLQQDQYDYLLQKLTNYQNDYFELGEKLKEATHRHAMEIDETTRRFMTIVNDKCNEIADLKSQIVYFKGLRCYKSDCPQRIAKNPKDGAETTGRNR